jgi:hypothetical protein
LKTRERLHQEIETTRNKFHHLLDSIPDEAFSLPSANPAWTVGEVLYHMSIAPRFMVLDVRMISQHQWMYKLIPKIFPKRLFDWLNARLTRYGARNLSRQFLSEQYEQANTTALQVLDSLSEEDLSKSVQYPDWDPLLTGKVSMVYLFEYIKRHFDSHAAQIESAIQRRSS